MSKPKPQKDAREERAHLESHEVETLGSEDAQEGSQLYTRKTILYPFRTEHEFLQPIDMPDRYYRTDHGRESRAAYRQNQRAWGNLANSMSGEGSRSRDPQDALRDYLMAGKPDDDTRAIYEDLMKNNDLDLQAQVNRRHVPNARRFVRACEEGDSVNIERAQERQSECWECHQFKSTRQRTVSIGINYSTGHHGKDLFQKLGAAAAVTLGILRSQGYRVRLVGTRIVQTAYGDPESDLVGMYWPIIDFGERFDIERILCWGHVGVFTWFARVWCYHLFAQDYPLINQKWGYAMIAPQIPTGALREAGVDHILYTPSSRGVHVGDIVQSTVKAVGGTFA
jgi:hypothetical protein